ncbi:MAG: phosphoribosylamine--glycine ligase [Acidobacteria bacterium]|nr:phosphoribosylamine--glycine ligase [Acidobacteriota bacterium]
MKVFVVGSGGREHALTWALSRSNQVKQIYSATTNAGILKLTTASEVNAGDIRAIAEFAKREQMALAVIGPEQPLLEGLSDALESRGIAVFGPSQAAARLEGSKVFSKEFMTRHHIPTARYVVVDDAAEAFRALGAFGYPVVIKADGLAAGKGVVVAADEAEARQAVQDWLVDRKLGEAGNRLVIEECLVGRELSYLVFSDGKDFAAMPVAQDHKRAFDGDRGPNTGGMGAFSTPGLIDSELEARIVKEIVAPSLEATRADGFPFRGVLYCGLMLTSHGPKTLEYNVRFGDPETQAILRRLESDFAELALAVARGELARCKPVWSDETSTCVVMASAGYPGIYETGKVIHGLEAAEQIESVAVFHAGTKENSSGEVVTAGGRVLGVTARAENLAEATKRAYTAVEKISFEGMQFRRDIGLRNAE